MKEISSRQVASKALSQRLSAGSLVSMVTCAIRLFCNVRNREWLMKHDAFL